MQTAPLSPFIKMVLFSFFLVQPLWSATRHSAGGSSASNGHASPPLGTRVTAAAAAAAAGFGALRPSSFSGDTPPPPACWAAYATTPKGAVPKKRGEYLGLFGPMSGGKTAELVRLVDRAERRGKKVLVIKPETDTRGRADKIASRTGTGHTAVNISPDLLAEITKIVFDREIDLLAIDEAQFFPLQIIAIIYTLLGLGVDVIVSALDLNFRGEEFNETVRRLMFLPGERSVFSAVCDLCRREDAYYSIRLFNGKPAPFDGKTESVEGTVAEEKYEARCYGCFRAAYPDEFRRREAYLEGPSA